MDIDVSEKSPREMELRRKIKDASERYESANGESVSLEDLRAYVEQCRRKEIFDHFQVRVGHLYSADRAIVMGILDEVSGAKKSKAKAKSKSKGE